MTPSGAAPFDPLDEAAEQDGELARVLEACLTSLEAGRGFDAEDLLAGHPAIAERLRGALHALRRVHRGAAGTVPAGRPGGFDALPWP